MFSISYTQSSRSFTLTLTVSLILLVVESVFAANDRQLSPHEHKGAQILADRLKIPQMLNFTMYKNFFKKEYRSEVEEMKRLTIYLGRSAEAFCSMLKYKLRLTGSYFGINQLSDLTQQERRRRHPRPCTKCASIAENKATGVIEEIPVEEELVLATRGPIRFPKGAPHHLGRTPRLPPEQANTADSWLGKLGNFLEKVCSPFGCAKTESDILTVEHTSCLLPQIEQGDCSSCYILTALSIYEWLYCKQTGKRIQFSAQYALDCGHRVELPGCGGGYEPDAAKFFAEYGLHLNKDYPYVGHEETCLVDLQPDGLGRILLNQTDLVPIKKTEIADKLLRSPVIATVGAGDRFDSYGGGVDMGDCAEDPGDHSMLIVGYGVEDGAEYWLLRNSYGPLWGQNGNYKLNMLSPCILENELYVAKASEVDAYSFLPNPHFNRSSFISAMRDRLSINSAQPTKL